MFGSKEKDRMRGPDKPAARTEPAVTSPPPPTPPPTPAPATETAPASERTVLGKGAKFTGNLAVHGTVVVEGEFEGTLECTEMLIVGKSGKLKAEVDVRDARVAGRVEGAIRARERVELETGSHLQGDVAAKSFMIQDGVFFQGKCSMGDDPEAAAKSKPTEPEPETEDRKPELGILKQS